MYELTSHLTTPPQCQTIQHQNIPYYKRKYQEVMERGWGVWPLSVGTALFGPRTCLSSAHIWDLGLINIKYMKYQKSYSPRVPRFQGSRYLDISKSYSNWELDSIEGQSLSILWQYIIYLQLFQFIHNKTQNSISTTQKPQVLLQLKKYIFLFFVFHE